jgi:hypothetical protein
MAITPFDRKRIQERIKCDMQIINKNSVIVNDKMKKILKSL